MYPDFRSVNSIKLLKPSSSSSKSWKSIAIRFLRSLWISLGNLRIWRFALEVPQALHSTVVMPFMHTIHQVLQHLWTRMPEARVPKQGITCLRSSFSLCVEVVPSCEECCLIDFFWDIFHDELVVFLFK